MFEIRGIRAPANQRHQGSEIINVKDSSTPTKTAWTICEGKQNHAELKLRDLIRAWSEQTVQHSGVMTASNASRTSGLSSQISSSPWRVLGSVTRCHESSAGHRQHLNYPLELQLQQSPHCIEASLQSCGDGCVSFLLAVFKGWQTPCPNTALKSLLQKVQDSVKLGGLGATYQMPQQLPTCLQLWIGGAPGPRTLPHMTRELY